MNFQTTTIILFLIFGFCWADDKWNLNLFEEHVPYFFYSNPELKQQCLNDPQCPYQKLLQEKKSDQCWGYETNCSIEEKISNVSCPDGCQGWRNEEINNKFVQKGTFWMAGDFGYIRQRKEQLKTVCTPQKKGDSSLECTEDLRYCRAKNIYMDFRKANLKSGEEIFREDVFQKNEIGGHCSLNWRSLKIDWKRKSPLVNWIAELENYTPLNFRPNSNTHCDAIIDKPTIFMKLDIGFNMYHHFCDFINLYVSQHMNNSFNADVYIVMWDTSSLEYIDLFKVVWEVFSKFSIVQLSLFEGKRVCFKEAMFPLLPRTQQGLYYLMPLVPGCTGSRLVRAFSQHILYRLNIIQQRPLPEKIRVTFLFRFTKYRQILNLKELASILKTITYFDVKVINFERRYISFKEQLKISHNTDIFIGMHGAGLTHCLFLPDWAVLFELYNCGDVRCYKDLSRLRGVKYLTWQKKSKLVPENKVPHPNKREYQKFINYSFDVEEFLRLVLQAADYVHGHPEFLNARAQKYQSKAKTEL